MPSQSRSSRPVRALLIAVMIVAPLSVFASLPWLKEQPDGVVFVFTGIASTLTVLAARAFGILQERGLDEWHRSAARFSSQWGWLAGASLVALLLAWPPVRDLVVSLSANLAGIADPDQKLVVLAFVFGFIATVLAQLMCTAVLGMIWASWKLRGPRDPA